jgi:hypothetical protein
VTLRSSKPATRRPKPRALREFAEFWARSDGAVLGHYFGFDGVIVEAQDSRGKRLGQFKTFAHARAVISAAARYDSAATDLARALASDWA